MVDTSGSTPALVGRKLNTLECFHWTVNDVVTYLKSIDSLKSEDLEEVCAAFQSELTCRHCHSFSIFAWVSLLT